MNNYILNEESVYTDLSVSDTSGCNSSNNINATLGIDNQYNYNSSISYNTIYAINHSISSFNDHRYSIHNNSMYLSNISGIFMDGSVNSQIIDNLILNASTGIQLSDTGSAIVMNNSISATTGIEFKLICFL